MLSTTTSSSETGRVSLMPSDKMHPGRLNPSTPPGVGKVSLLAGESCGVGRYNLRVAKGPAKGTFRSGLIRGLGVAV